MEALSYDGPADKAIDAIAAAVESSSRTTITNRTDTQIDSVFTSLIFRFKDDVTFLVDSDAHKIHFRSASRTGHSDLGANRKRLAALLPMIKAKL